MKIGGVDDLKKVKEMGVSSLYPENPKVKVSLASCGAAAGARNTLETFEDKLENTKFGIGKIGCIGICQREPIFQVHLPGLPILVFGDADQEKTSEIADELAAGNIPVERALFQIENENEVERSENSGFWDRIKKTFKEGDIEDGLKKVRSWSELPFFSKQKRVAMRNCGIVDPKNIKEYIGRDGYFSLLNALNQDPSEIVEEIKKSGLQGRGGAGFPTGLKWEFAHQAEGNEKYVICNADEGDPGAYMDRNLLESDPHTVIEGMVIGAYAIGAVKGYVYVRQEYPLAQKRLNEALKQAREWGLLGEGIAGSDFDFDIKISPGAGAFVCGEETALMRSIEGKPGEPVPRPPFPAEKGLHGEPTNINNVETWGNIPVVLEKGAEWYSDMGTEKSKGTKVFSLVGDIKTNGLIEVEMGTSLREIIYDIGGGVTDGEFKAVQTGGPSGGVIPKEHLDAVVDYETLDELGSIMGSGGMVVMNDNTCMIDTAKYFVDFTLSESCGKCTPCREGLKNMSETLEEISKGKGKKRDMEDLRELSQVVQETSLCGLGETAPNPILTTLTYFEDEYREHIEDKKCRAGVCKELIEYHITEDCIACGSCLEACPEDAIIEGEEKYSIDQEKCIKCGTCSEVCPTDAVEVI